MKRTIIGIVIGSIIGGITFFPPAIPIYLMLNYESLAQSKIGNMLFWLLPLIGLIIGGVLGGFVRKNRISLAISKHKSLSIVSWSVLIFGLIGIEIGFVLSPAAGIGLGNIPTPADPWLPSFVLGIVGTNLGTIVGLLVLAVYLLIKKFNDRKTQAEK